MADEIVRIITADGFVQASAITAVEMVSRAKEIHDCSPVATAALGRALMGASLMGNQLKGEEDSITLQFKGDGPLGLICCVSDSQGYARGYVANHLVETSYHHPGKLNVGAAVGKDGYLTVIKDLGLKEPYVGSVPLVSGEIAEDITGYFATSEQIPTACALGVLVNQEGEVTAAAGYLIQLLPGAPDQVIDKIEAGIRRIPSVTQAMTDGLNALDLIAQVLGDFQLQVLETQPVGYRCTCSRERVEKALISMGREELEAMIREDGKADLTCSFCDQVYHFTKEDLEGLL